MTDVQCGFVDMEVLFHSALPWFLDPPLVFSPLSGSSSSASSSSASSPSVPLRCFLRLFFTALAFFLASMRATTAERLFSPLSRSSIFSAKCCRASLRFCSRERVSWHLTTMPVGMCLS